jgi:hypothetical protein
MMVNGINFFFIQSLLGLFTTSCVVTAQDSCTFDYGTFQRGESLGNSFVNRCGEDFPCFCNPDVDGQVECPYCGFATNTPNLLRCATDGQTILHIDLDGKGQSCTCDASDPTDPRPVCVEDESALVCTFEMEDGTIETRQPGEEIGFESRCSNVGEFPCFCNPNLPMQIECPYCSFATNRASTVFCVAEGEAGSFIDGDGRGQACTCVLGETPAFPANPSCQEVDVEEQESCTYTVPSTGQEVTLTHLEVDVNVPRDVGSAATCQCVDGFLDCGDPVPTDDDEPTNDEAPTPSESLPTPRPNPLPTPTAPIAAPTLPQVDIDVSDGSGATGRTMALAVASASLLAATLAVVS